LLADPPSNETIDVFYIKKKAANPSNGFISGRVWAMISNGILVKVNRDYVGRRREEEV